MPDGPPKLNQRPQTSDQHSADPDEPNATAPQSFCGVRCRQVLRNSQHGSIHGNQEQRGQGPAKKDDNGCFTTDNKSHRKKCGGKIHASIDHRSADTPSSFQGFRPETQAALPKFNGPTQERSFQEQSEALFWIMPGCGGSRDRLGLRGRAHFEHFGRGDSFRIP